MQLIWIVEMATPNWFGLKTSSISVNFIIKFAFDVQIFFIFNRPVFVEPAFFDRTISLYHFLSSFKSVWIVKVFIDQVIPQSRKRANKCASERARQKYIQQVTSTSIIIYLMKLNGLKSQFYNRPISLAIQIYLNSQSV